MDNGFDTRRRWSTSSFGSPPDTSPMEIASLLAHLTVCEPKHRRLFVLQCLGDAVHAFMAPRLMTTFALIVALIGAVWLVM